MTGISHAEYSGDLANRRASEDRPHGGPLTVYH